MSISWVAGSVRAAAMARRRYGAAAARSLATSSSLDEAVDRLATTAYGHDLAPGMRLDEAQRSVAATLLWHLRVLAGWTPWEGTQVLRSLAAGFEVANVDELLRALDDAPSATPYRLGALSTWWPHLEGAASLGELRTLLSTSPWGDPGRDSAQAIQTTMRLAWARRTDGQVPEAWRLGGAALLVARERFAAGHELEGAAADLARVLVGEGAVTATSLEDLAGVLPREAAWVLDGIHEPGELWQGEAVWWRRVEHDGFRLLTSAVFGPDRLVGAAAVLAVDAWRVRAALEVAARRGVGLEVFDAIA